MNRRQYLSAVGVALTIGVAGCSGTDDGETEDEEDIDYDIDPENFEVDTVTISKNAPDKVGVTINAASKQFAGTSIGVEVWILDENQEVLFHEPVFGMGLSGGNENTETCWFKVDSFDQLTETMVPKVRLRTSPPEN